MNALVYKSTGSWYTVKDDSDRIWNARMKGVLKMDEITSTNPVTDLLQIQLPQGNHYDAITIHDASGKLVLQKLMPNSSPTLRLDIRHLAAGWYTLKLSGKENWRGSFIKK